jgi:hypothetical protein
MSFVGRTLIPAPHGQLEAIYRRSEAAERAALVLHPHPLYGGTMHNKVVFQTAKALEAAGFVTLRFNFRGVGDSTGNHDGGRGATDDARTALDYLLAHQPATRGADRGFSFGATVTVRFGCGDGASSDDRDRHAGELARCRSGGTLQKPLAFIHGDRDDGPPSALQTLSPTDPAVAARLPAPDTSSRITSTHWANRPQVGRNRCTQPTTRLIAPETSRTPGANQSHRGRPWVA